MIEIRVCYCCFPFLKHFRFVFCLFFPGMTWEQCLQKCPQGVVPACHNAEDTVTISGPQVRYYVAMSSDDIEFVLCVFNGEFFHSI